MTAPNHVVGGTLFTAFFASIFNINIFDSWQKLAVTLFFALLPDADHTRSPLGLAFYPISKRISERYGHRTITHSLLFLVATTTICYVIAKVAGIGTALAVIAFFAVLSHFILDMVTIAGIPLFYPFYRNPCVIPGKPEYRLESGNLRTEAIALLIFGTLTFTLQPLFTNGFWTTWNSAFGTLKHINREAKEASDFIVVEYRITMNGEQIQSNGILIESSDNHCVLIEKNKLITLQEQDPHLVIHHLKPIHTKKDFKIMHLEGFTEDIDSLNRITSGKFCSGLIKANLPIFCTINGITEQTKSIQLKHTYNPQLYQTNDTVYNQIQAKIRLKRVQLEQEREKHLTELEKYEQLKELLKQAQEETKKAKSINERVTAEEQYFSLKTKVQNSIKPTYTPNKTLLTEIEELQKQDGLKTTKNTIFYQIQYPLLP